MKGQEDLDQFLEYLEYQRHYSKYTVDNYQKDIIDYLGFLGSRLGRYSTPLGIRVPNKSLTRFYEKATCYL